jgi:heme A synthase
MAETQKKFSRRTIALFWLLAVAILIGVLIYFQQIAVLYVLATIGLVALMLLVGFSDLENVDRDAAAGFTANK